MNYGRVTLKKVTRFFLSFSFPLFYQVHKGTRAQSISDKIKILPFGDFCKETGLL